MRVSHIIIISSLKNSILFTDYAPRTIITSDKLFAVRFGVQKKSRDHETFFMVRLAGIEPAHPISKYYSLRKGKPPCAKAVAFVPPATCPLSSQTALRQTTVAARLTFASNDFVASLCCLGQHFLISRHKKIFQPFHSCPNVIINDRYNYLFFVFYMINVDNKLFIVQSCSSQTLITRINSPSLFL